MPAGLRVLVIGLGRFGGGVGVTRWLADQGASVTVTDLADRDALADSIEALGSDQNITFQLGGHDLRQVEKSELVVINPAVVKSRSELFQAVQAAGVPWTTEINLFCERCPAPVIGITGAYGKSTTSAMLAHVLETAVGDGATAYTAVHLGGNIGRSLLPELPNIRERDIVVLEMSNAQLEDLPRIPWTPRWAAITNLRPHHLDRYERYDDYVAAKLNIVGQDGTTEALFAGELDPVAERALAERLAPGLTRLIRLPAPSDEFTLRVPGRHNQLNAGMASAICQHLGVSRRSIEAALADFRGLPHRLEHVGTRSGVEYYNDSKSTAPTATLQAVEALTGPLIVLVGGQSKSGLDLSRFVTTLGRKCRLVIGFGQAGPEFIEAVRSTLPPDRARVAADLDAAFRLACETASPGDQILLSPGAASFDAYANYTERGRHFVNLVEALP